MSLTYSVKDRTAEFRSCVESIRNRSAAPQAKQRVPNGQAVGGSKGEFARRAQAIGKDISATTVKLGKLAQLARRKTLFDDRPVEISELTYIIKHDIAAINRQLADLQAFNKAQKAGGSKGPRGQASVDEHRGNVVTLLQTKLAGATTSFKDILEVRTQNMKASRDRTEQFMFAGSSPALPPGENSILRARKQNASGFAPAAPAFPDSPLYNPSRAGSTPANRDQLEASYTGNVDAEYRGDSKGKGKAYDDDFLALDMGGSNGGNLNGTGGGQTANGGQQYMQMQLMENQQDNYVQQRSTAIESIESTISELGQIFGQLAHMVAEQRETVQRIDDNTTDIADNVSGAQRELLKYYASVSSNRWLMLKIFGVLIVFFLLFILVS